MVCVPAWKDREKNSFIDQRQAISNLTLTLCYCAHAHSSDDWRQVAAGEPDVVSGWMSEYKDLKKTSFS